MEKITPKYSSSGSASTRVSGRTVLKMSQKSGLSWPQLVNLFRSEKLDDAADLLQLAYFKDGLEDLLSVIDIEQVLGPLQKQKILSPPTVQGPNTSSQVFKWICDDVDNVTQIEAFHDVLRDFGFGDQIEQFSSY